MSFVRGRIISRRPETWRGWVLEVQLPAAAAAHTRAGQVCRLRLGGLEGWFAIAQAPGPGPLRFYVQTPPGPGEALAEALAALDPDDTLEVEGPQGAGFGLDEVMATGGPVLMAGTGSGISGLLGVIEVLEAAGADATLYLGARAPGDFAFLHRLLPWQARGGTVHLVLSGPAPGWTGRRGYVQHAITEDDPRPAHVLACGHPAMQDAVAAWAASRGVAGGRVRTNH